MRFRQSGFTLLELLIALALIGLMVVLLFGALRFSGKAWDGTEGRSERSTAVRLIWHYLGDRLEQARPVQAHVESVGESHFFFTGSAEAMEFVSPMPAQLGSGGLYIIRLETTGGHGKKQLRLRRWLYHPEVLAGADSMPEWKPLGGGVATAGGKDAPDLRAYYSQTLLVDELKKFEISYFGPEEKNDDTGDWSTEWEDKEFLPWLVKLRIEDAAGDWPEMIYELPN